MTTWCSFSMMMLIIHLRQKGQVCDYSHRKMDNIPMPCMVQNLEHQQQGVVEINLSSQLHSAKDSKGCYHRTGLQRWSFHIGYSHRFSHSLKTNCQQKKTCPYSNPDHQKETIIHEPMQGVNARLTTSEVLGERPMLQLWRSDSPYHPVSHMSARKAKPCFSLSSTHVGQCAVNQSQVYKNQSPSNYFLFQQSCIIQMHVLFQH